MGECRDKPWPELTVNHCLLEPLQGTPGKKCYLQNFRHIVLFTVSKSFKRNGANGGLQSAKYDKCEISKCETPLPQHHGRLLTHWGRVTHICVSKLTITGSDNGLSPDRRQAIIWNNAGILLMGPSGTNFSEILIEILTFSFKKMRLKVSSAKRRPFCLGLNVLTDYYIMVMAGCNSENDINLEN